MQRLRTEQAVNVTILGKLKTEMSDLYQDLCVVQTDVGQTLNVGDYIQSERARLVGELLAARQDVKRLETAGFDQKRELMMYKKRCEECESECVALREEVRKVCVCVCVCVCDACLRIFVCICMRGEDLRIHTHKHAHIRS
jgi:hypothetical protein